MKKLNLVYVLLIVIISASCKKTVEYNTIKSYYCSKTSAFGVSSTENDSSYADRVSITRISKLKGKRYLVDLFSGNEHKTRLGVFLPDNYYIKIDEHGDTLFTDSYSMDEGSIIQLGNFTNYKIEDVFEGSFDTCIITSHQNILASDIIHFNVFIKEDQVK
jgi:hypothetical protein